MLKSTSPSGKILMYKFGVRMLWKAPIFSFLKKVSGIHTLLESVRVRYLIRSEKKAQLHIFDSVLTLFMLYGHCCKSQGGHCEIIMTFFGTVRKSNCRFNSSFLLKSAQQCHEGDFEIALKYTWPPLRYPTFTNIIFLNMEDG